MTNPTTTASPSAGTPRATVAVTDLVRLANCPVSAGSGPAARAPSPGVPGDHLARWQRAERRGLIGREDLAAVVAGLEVIAAHVIILDGAPVREAGWTAPRPGWKGRPGLINFRVGAWQDFGYAEPPTPDCATIPPLGERSAEAIKAGHEAVKDIDQLIAQLHQVRAQLISELRQDEDIRAARVDKLLARTRHAADGDRRVSAADARAGAAGTGERLASFPPDAELASDDRRRSCVTWAVQRMQERRAAAATPTCGEAETDDAQRLDRSPRPCWPSSTGSTDGRQYALEAIERIARRGRRP